MVLLPKQMLSELLERQAAIQARVDKYAPIREAFEEFLKAGRREDDGFFWSVCPGARKSRYHWTKQEVVEAADKGKIVVEALTDPTRYRFGRHAGDIKRALIDVRVSLPENPTVDKKLELPPVWVIVKQVPGFSPEDLERLGEDLEEIVPLVRACLPQG